MPLQGADDKRQSGASRSLRCAFASVCGLSLAVVCVLTLQAGCDRSSSGAKPGASASPAPSATPAVSVSASPATSGSAEVGDAGVDVNPDVDPDFAWLPPRTVKLNSPYKIAAKATQTWVHLYPDDETPYLGYIRAGRVVDRSESWIVKTMRCQEGWYEVLPAGYVCDGNRATLDVNDPVVVASWKPARRGEPLPYHYIRPNDPRAYVYFTLPSMKDQLRTEGQGLTAHLGSHPTERLPNIDVLGDPEPIPPFLAYGHELPTPFGATKRLRYNVHEGRANPQAAFSLFSTHDFEGRRFGFTTELDLLPIDRVKIIRPTTRKGSEIDDLPAAIVRAAGAARFTVDDTGNPIKDGAFEPFHVLDLTGKMHRNLWETRDGSYVIAGTFQMVEARTSFPSFAKDDRKWVDVSIKEQVLVAYIGKKAVYVAQVSTGLGEMADPEKSFATIRGSFTIKSKHVTSTMTGSRQADDYELADVPYVQFFHEGYALHGTFWHDNFGRVQSHGCVNLTPTDAAWVFEFTNPPVPESWHGVIAGDDAQRSVVNVRY